MLPFFAAGAAAISTGWRILHSGGPKEAMVVMFAVGILFCGVAATVVFAAFWGIRTMSAAASAREMNPDRPWLWHTDWAQGVLRESRGAEMLLLWPFAIFWNLISTPVWFVVSRELAKQNRLILIMLLFPLIGAGLLGGAIYVTARRAKFGISTCTIDGIPLQPGRTFHGELQMRGHRRPDDGFNFTLAAVRIITRGSGDSRSVKEDPVWSESRVVSASVAAPTPDGMRVPFSFDLPPDAPSTDEVHMDDRLVWRLEVSAALPGPDYSARFELPVFHTGDDVALAEKVAKYRHAQIEELTRRELPHDSQLTIDMLPSGGTEFRIRPRREFGSIFSSIVFLIIWIGAIITMIKLGAPIGFPIFFALFAILIIAGIADAFFGRSAVVADRTGLTLRRTIFGKTWTTVIPAAEITKIDVTPSGSTSKPLYDIEVHRKGTTPRPVGCYLRAKDDAQIVVARMLRAVGRE
jgi:hypothetical protein